MALRRKARNGGTRKARSGGLASRLLLAPIALLAAYYGLCLSLLLLYTVIPPPFTGVQIQRRIEALAAGKPYEKQFRPVPSGRIAKHLGHAVIAAEDGRFREHFGVDWEALRQAIEDNRRRGRAWRGGSTITQQLVKNLFMTTHSSYLRKALEFPLAYMAEVVLSKDRILYLYLTVIEWGDGVYGAEAAARHHYDKPAAELSRRQAASLAAITPSPRRRNPHRMQAYTRTIERRMRALGY